MENKIINQLKTLQAIEPDRGFALKSKVEILNSPRRSVFPFASPYLALGALAVLISVAGLGINAINVRRERVEIAQSLNSEALKAELSSLPINIQLAELEYYQDLDAAISLSLREIKNGKDDNTKEINDLLEKLL